MKTASRHYAQNFGRAFTAKEKEDYKRLIKDAGKALGVQETQAVIFDFNAPSKQGYNTGIGTTFSDNAAEFTKFLKDMTGISSIQLGPEGKISQANNSPYSGTNYAIGTHIIDAEKLTKPEYIYLLEESDVKNADENYEGSRLSREYKTDYRSVLGADGGKGVQENLLRKAYMNFICGMTIYHEDAERLNIKFNKFKEENKDWLERETAFTVLSKIYGTDDYNTWPEEYRDLYSEYMPEDIRQQKLKQLRKDNKDDFQYEDFKQFLADMQQKEAKAKLNSMGIKLYGDALLGFSKSEVWANKDCFNDYQYYGCISEHNGMQMWGLNAVDYSQIGECTEWSGTSELGASGKLLYDKFCRFFKRYDGIRADAAWQFVTPFVYEETIGGTEQVPMPNFGDTILNIIKTAAKDTLGSKYDENNIVLEFLGSSGAEAAEQFKNNYTHLYSGYYGLTPKQLQNEGYGSDKYIIGAGNHDNDSLVNLSRKNDMRTEQMNKICSEYQIQPDAAEYQCGEYKRQNNEEKEQENFRNTKLAAMFTGARQFYTLPDMFGMSERINVPGRVSDDNWTPRIPSDYERFYFSQLSKGYGLNMPKALACAMKMLKIKNPGLEAKLNEAAEILRMEGPLTQSDSDAAEKIGLLKNRFKYNA